MVTNTQPHHPGRIRATTLLTGLALTAMTFSFLFGPASVTECFLLDANLPTVAKSGAVKWRAREDGRLRGGAQLKVGFAVGGGVAASSVGS
jgi:hypothetical protein